MAVKFLDKTGLGYFWGKIKAWCNSTFAVIAHTHTSYAVKHSYTTAANAAKNWYRIANANTSQLDTTKPIRAQFIVTAYNTSYAADYYETWFVNAIVFGRTAHIIVFGASAVPFSQARILYENTAADIDANDRPAIDLYLNYVLPNGTTKIEVEEIYNSGWTFVADGQLAASSAPSGFEGLSSAPRNNGVNNSTYADYVSYLNRQISNFNAAFTLADSYLYRSRTLNCTGTFTITIPSINSGYMWCVIKNKNTSSGVITLHPSTTSVLIDGSNANITLQPMEYVCIHSAGANNYSLIADGRWKSQKADKATTLAGYGITDAKIANGTITLGSNSITPLTSVPSHNQASNTINAMTGYSKPNSTSAIATSDTLNSAIGKLEAKVDAVDSSNVVHKTGNENILGIKSFKVESNNETNGIVIQSSEIVRGTAPSSDKFCTLGFADSTFDVVEDGNDEDAVTPSRLAVIDYAARSTGRVDFQFYVLNPKSKLNEGIRFRIGYEADGTQFFLGPSTKDNPYSNEIITYDWLPKDTRLVHTTGNEIINDTKLFTGDVKSDSYYYSYFDILKGATITEPKYRGIVFGDSNRYVSSQYRLGHLMCQINTDGTSSTYISSYKNEANTNTGASLLVGWDSTNSYAAAPSTRSDRTAGTDIVTRNWIPNDTRIVHTSGNENIAGVKHFTSGYTIITTTTDYGYSKIRMNFKKGSANPSTTKQGCFGVFENGQTTDYYDNRVGTFEVIANTNGNITTGIWAYKNQSANHTGTSVLLTFPKDGVSTSGYVMCPAVNPHVDNQYTIGAASTRWKVIYAVTGTINTSDERVKHEIDKVSDIVLDAWEDIEWKQFKMLDAVQEKGINSARIHVGAIAQYIDAVFKSHDLDASRYGLFCYDEWEEEKEVRNQIGDIVTNYRPAGNRYSLRYEEALCMEAAYQRRKNKILENRISELEKRLAKLEGVV